MTDWRPSHPSICWHAHVFTFTLRWHFYLFPFRSIWIFSSEKCLEYLSLMKVRSFFYLAVFFVVLYDVTESYNVDCWEQLQMLKQSLLYRRNPSVVDLWCLNINLLDLHLLSKTEPFRLMQMRFQPPLVLNGQTALRMSADDVKWILGWQYCVISIKIDENTVFTDTHSFKGFMLNHLFEL